jgi:RNA polymerase sigma-70 factor, ECF subfamily
VIQLNHAVAVAMAEGPDRGLALLNRPELARQLEDYHLFHAARADLLRRGGDRQAAAGSYRRALEVCRHAPDRHFLQRRLAEVSVP